MYDELSILGLVFINIIVVFYIYRYFKNKYAIQIKKLQQQNSDLQQKESVTPHEIEYTNAKKSFVTEQIKKIEALEKELAKQKKTC